MKIFKNKKIFSIALFALIILGIVIYFLPLSFASVNEQNIILITHSIIQVKDGIPLIHSENYNNITITEKKEIVSLFSEFNYYRKWNTFFTNGELSGLGNDLIYLNLYDGNIYLDTLTITSNGEISLKGKTYKMKNSEDLICRILEILDPS